MPLVGANCTMADITAAMMEKQIRELQGEEDNHEIGLTEADQ